MYAHVDYQVVTYNACGSAWFGDSTLDPIKCDKLV